MVWEKGDVLGANNGVHGALMILFANILSKASSSEGFIMSHSKA